MFTKNKYVVVGSFSELTLNQAVEKREKGFVVKKKVLKKIVIATLSAVLIGMLSDVSFAAGIQDAFSNYSQPAVPAMANSTFTQVTGHNPTQLKHILEYVNWLVEMLRLVVSSIAGLICTFAGYKWATTIDGNGAETAKKILKNAFVGGLIVFAGTTIADFFVGKMEQILLG